MGGRGRRRDSGASAVEYALILTAIAAVIVVAVFALGHITASMFEQSTTCIQNHDAASC